MIELINYVRLFKGRIKCDHLPDEPVTLKFVVEDYIRHYKRYPLVLALSEDGKIFDQTYAICTEPTVPRFEVGGSSDGYQYPDAVVIGDSLWVIYSVYKQDISISKLNWREL